MKKTIQVALWFISGVLLLSVCSVSVSALVIKDGSFGYELNSTKKEARLVSYSGNDAAVNVPSYYGDYSVKTVASTAFADNASVEEVNIPASVTTIESNAFANCTSLNSLIVPFSVTLIGSDICNGCSALSSASIVPSFVKIPDYMFSGCSSLTSVSINPETSKIGEGAFKNCSSLENIDFIENVSEISEFAFSGSGIKRLVVPENVSVLPYRSFADCDALEQVVIGKNVNEISPYAFSGSDSVIIYCYHDSYAHQFAIDRNIPFVFLDAFLGDVNADDNVDVADVTKIQQFIAELAEIDGIYLKAADVNNDGEVNISDATAIQMYVAEYDTGYPIGEIMPQ